MKYLKKLGFYIGLALALVGSMVSIPGGMLVDLGEWIISLLGFSTDEQR